MLIFAVERHVFYLIHFNSANFGLRKKDWLDNIPVSEAHPQKENRF